MKDSEGEENDDRNVFTLLSQLQKEKLFITNEKLNIQKLNEEIKVKTESLIKSTWITTKQRLYLLGQREFTIQNYKHIKSIVNSEFVEAKTVLKFQSIVKIENLLQILRTQPEQFARWLFKGEQLGDDDSVHFSQVLQSIVTGLYSSCLFPEDTNFMLKLLYELAKLQVVKSENPRRMLKQSSCSFRSLYFIFNEVLPTAKIFLSAALEIPILRLLAYRELHLDIDPNKSMMRFRQDDGIRNEFKTLQEYRDEIVRKLSSFANGFIQSLRENLYSFPKSIAWIVFKISKIISKSFGAKEANAIVTELIFTLYICPAIVDPEQYSICDSQITDISRHNLMQIGQILQVLALNKFETPDSRFRDIYNLFDKDTVATFMEDVLFNLDHEDEPPVDITPGVVRDWVLFEEEELNYLVMLLQKIHEINQGSDISAKKQDLFGNTSIEEQIASLVLPPSLENSPKSQKPYTNGFGDGPPPPLIKKSNFLSLVRKNHHQFRRETEENDIRPLSVIIFSIDKAIPEPVGLLSEEKVLKRSVSEDVSLANEEPSNREECVVSSAEIINNASSSNAAVNYQDEGSIGNTSDNLEAISEAASNHSVASSLELENEDQNDNLSDMISANVSGRGTPNISGRDTPSSQVNDNEQLPIPEARQENIPAVQPQISRQIRSEIDDKFCKFEIKKLLEGDETISIISETWSTDVLASDNETIDAGDVRERAERLRGLQLVDQAINEAPLLDISETQSESAWSTDVTASDTERLQEVENDDTRSETDENIRKLSNASSSFYQEYRKVEVKNDTKTDSNANNLGFKSLSSLTEMKTSYNRVSTTGRCQMASKDGAGPSGAASGGLMKQNGYDERPSEILLSNCSLNSSSSGSSSNSFENNKLNQESCEQWESKQWLNSSGSSLNATSTPSESTSELSVLSVNNPAHPIRKVTSQVTSRSLKPSAATGAIPKSISFDMSADKGLDDDGKNKRTGFFGKFKMGFRNRRVKSFRNQFDFQFDGNEEFLTAKRDSVKLNNSEVSEDILAKYRSKTFLDASPLKNSARKQKTSRSESEELDINNSFDDIKKKLRIVLSNITSQTPKIITEKSLSVKCKIETVLRLELGKTRKLKEYTNIARISETLRFINCLNEPTCATLLQSMQEDFAKRAPYVQYLIGSRQELLFCQSYLDDLNEQISNEKHQCDEYLSMICVRQFLVEQEQSLLRFCDEFKEIHLSDEKCDYLNKFYKQLYAVMQNSILWQDIFRNRCDIIKITLERCVISKVYEQALYPNGDGDRHRDFVLFQHIEKLSNIITPDHKDVLIHKMYLRELPWVPAQDALKAMGAYRTPRDQVNCVVHCAKCIMDLLSFSQASGSQTADDFTPVLVYVIIKVNPANLLSTIQFVNSFYLNKLHGEEQYWWTQFCSAVEYIKTMDYSD